MLLKYLWFAMMRSFSISDYTDSDVRFIVHPFCDNFKPRFSSQMSSSVLGGVKSIRIAVLWSH
jgi:hypothetical protein